MSNDTPNGCAGAIYALAATLIITAMFWCCWVTVGTRTAQRRLDAVEERITSEIAANGIDQSDRELLAILREERSRREQAERRGALPPLGDMGVVHQQVMRGR